MTNRKSHMGFPLTPRSMTLVDLKFYGQILWNFATFLDFGGYTNEDRPALSATEL